MSDEKEKKETRDLAERMAAAQEAEDAQNATEASYTVIREKVKRKPKKIGKLLRRIAFLLVGAVLFGILSAYVFSRFAPVFSPEEPEPIEIAQDPTPTPSLTPAPTPSPAATPLPTPIIEQPKAPSPEEESEERIRENRLLYSDLKAISAQPAKAVVTVTAISTTEDWFRFTNENRRETSGLIFAETTSEYHLLTDYSVVEGASSILATMYDGSIAECSFVKQDPSTGLGVLTVGKRALSEETRSGITPASLGNSYIVSQGDPVIAIGSPMGYGNAVAFGQITSVTNTVSLVDAEYTLIQTNIQGSQNSSGALINMSGEIIGFISQKHADKTGSSVVTALSVSQLKQIIGLISNREPIAYFGITGEDVTEEISRNFNIPTGIYVTEVTPDSPAFNAGIQRGDILCEIGERAVTRMSAFSGLLNHEMAGTQQTVLIRRFGADGYAEIPLTVTVGEL